MCLMIQARKRRLVPPIRNRVLLKSKNSAVIGRKKRGKMKKRATVPQEMKLSTNLAIVWVIGYRFIVERRVFNVKANS